MTCTTRARLQALGLLDAAGNVTEAGERWTDEQMERLRREAARESEAPAVRWR